MHIEITKEMISVAAIIAAACGTIGTTGAAIVTAKDAKAKAEALQDEMKVQKEAINKMVGSVDQTIEEVSKKIVVDIPEHVVDEAVKKAADKAADRACQVAVHKVTDDIHSQVVDSVQEVMDKIEPKAESEIRKEFRRKMNTINVQKVKDDVCREVKKELIDQAKSEVDRITSSFADQIDQQAQLFKTINNKLNAV